MWPLAWRLQRAGFATHCYRYASLAGDVIGHGADFHEYLSREADATPGRAIHIVAHSMGGIVTRQALTRPVPEPVKRVVTLATPHSGSPVARRLVDHGLGFIRTLRDVADDPESLALQLGPVHHLDLATITASYDWVIPQSNTRVAGEREHARLFSGHNGLLVRPRAAALVIRYLKTGTFREPGRAVSGSPPESASRTPSQESSH